LKISNKAILVLKHLGIFAVIAMLLLLLNWLLGDTSHVLSEGSVGQVAALIKSWGIAAPLLSILLMIFQSISAPIPAFLITGANGAIFGVFWGVIISWIGAMFGGVIAFFLARWFGETFVKKMIKNNTLWEKVDEISSKYGFKVILIGRLLPFISFDFISYAAGLSKIRVVPFSIATGIGMLPGTVAYVLLGNQMAQFESFFNIAAIATIATIIFLVGFGVVKYIRENNKRNEEAKHD
jgi:uncharacterized membrane protein YdjX (TVP38/TMEM64 family)